MSLKLLKIPRFRPYFSYRILKRILGVAASGELFEGDCTERFEREFASYMGRKHAIATSSGRMALFLCLKALGFGHEDEIILPAYTVPEVVTMIRCAQLKACFVDSDALSYNMAPGLVAESITERTKAMLMTHMYGKPCDVEALLGIAKDYNLAVIEDAAQACGAEYKRRKCGSFGVLSYFSFGLVKNMNTLGGGMITTDDDALAETIREMMRDYPYPSRCSLLRRAVFCSALWIATAPLVFTVSLYPLLLLLDFLESDAVERVFDEDPEELAVTELPDFYRRKFTNLQAAVGLEQLKTLDRHNKIRMANARLLRKSLTGIETLTLPSASGESGDICLNFLVQSSRRDALLKRLLRRGIDTTKGYLKNCAGLSLFGEFKRQCPVAEKLSRNGFYLPVYPALSGKDICYIIEVIKKISETQ
jgi:dTDP-4-amino-4,6-dideoxygalactose transaminase